MPLSPWHSDPHQLTRLMSSGAVTGIWTKLLGWLAVPLVADQSRGRPVAPNKPRAIWARSTSDATRTLLYRCEEMGFRAPTPNM